RLGRGLSMKSSMRFPTKRSFGKPRSKHSRYISLIWWGLMSTSATSIPTKSSPSKPPGWDYEATPSIILSNDEEIRADRIPAGTFLFEEILRCEDRARANIGYRLRAVSHPRYYGFPQPGRKRSAAGRG